MDGFATPTNLTMPNKSLKWNHFQSIDNMFLFYFSPASSFNILISVVIQAYKPNST